MQDNENLVFGVIVGNRSFFPDALAREGRKKILDLLKKLNIEPVIVGPGETKHGCVQNYKDSKICAELFRKHRRRIDGIIVTLPNFGEERDVAMTLRLSGLNVPVLIQATPDERNKMDANNRGDSFCGKISVCNNLKQYNIPFSLTKTHTIDPDSEEFKKDLEWFGAVCRVVKGLRNIRIGAMGARPAAFNTVRYSEKILENYGIDVEVIDLLDVIGRVERLSDSSPRVIEALNEIHAYVPCSAVPKPALIKMAKLYVVISEWIESSELQGTAIQCWTALEEYFGIVPCTLMSMMSERLIPSACEVDITGLLGMLALQMASRQPSALVDWNNNYGRDPEKGVFFHCGNLSKSFLHKARMDFQQIIAGSVGKDNAFGTCVGRIKSGPMTFARVSTSDSTGKITGYTGEGEFTDDLLNTFGAYGVFKIRNLQSVLAYICENGYEHHVAVSRSNTAPAIAEAAKYLGWEMKVF